MRSLTGLCFGAALVAAALALSGAPASAIETQPGAQAAQAGNATPVTGEAVASSGTLSAITNTL